ncbi:MAG: carotenoid biosynthesis protein [Chloroflexi bacterium]|nr:carotenoid biosynthesis protein [Chloroflexota bacterium]
MLRWDSLKVQPVMLVVLSLWVLTMILTPIVGWTWGGTALRGAIQAGVLLQVAAVLTALFLHIGRRTLLPVGIVLPLAWLAEFVGSHTGLPFGRYSYTDVLQPQLGDVPLLIPLAWLMMLPPAWAVADLLAPRGPRWGKAVVAALAFTAWDLFLDPQMVAWDFWRWHEPGAYFGIPLLNYFGWLLVSFLITCAALPTGLPRGGLLTIYIITWVLQTIGQAFFWSMPGPAAFGFVCMGIFGVLALRTYRVSRP